MTLIELRLAHASAIKLKRNTNQGEIIPIFSAFLFTTVILAIFTLLPIWMQWVGGLGIVVLSIAAMIQPGLAAKRLDIVEDYENDLIGSTRAYARRIFATYAILTMENARFFSFIAGKNEDGQVSELDLPEGVRALYDDRDDQFYFTEEDTKLQEGDEIVILTKSKHLSELDERWNPAEIESEDRK